MELIRTLLTLLGSLEQVTLLARIEDLKPVSATSVFVTYEGARSPQATASVCRVHVFRGPAYSPENEVAVAAACEIVREAVLTGDGFDVGDWEREPEDTIERLPFAHLSLEVYEVGL